MLQQYKSHLDEKKKRGRMGRYVVFTTTLIEWSGFNPQPGHIVASLD